MFCLWFPSFGGVRGGFYKVYKQNKYYSIFLNFFCFDFHIVAENIGVSYKKTHSGVRKSKRITARRYKVLANMAGIHH